MNNKFISSALGFSMKVDTHTKINLPDFSILRGKRVKHIDVLDFESSSLFSGYMPTADVNITLREQNTQLELIKKLPLSLLHCKEDRLFINKIIDFPHSYIDPSALDLSQGAKTFYFVVWYDDPDYWNLVPKKKNRTEVQPLEINIREKVTYFGEDNVLKNRMFQNLMLSFPKVTPEGHNGVDAMYSKNMFLTLAYRGKEFIKNVPLEIFYQNDTPYPLRLQNIKFDLTSSYIEVIGDFAEIKDKSVFFNCVIDANH